MDYRSMIETAVKNGGGEKAMWKSVEATNAAMEYIREKDPAKYHSLLRDLHEDLCGAHYDKEFATEAVAEMYHTAPDGSKRYGERWTIDEVKAAVEPFRGKMHDKDNCWDAYVAVHMWWHDLGRNYKQRDPNNYESALIEDAVTWAFCDEDAPDGKIWHYIQSMSRKA